MTSATALARHLLAQWVQWGVEHVVLCPGSRSAALAFAAYAAAERGEITLHTRIDERTAGFLALGIAKNSRRPAAMFTTSGTAAANLHPAVLEAAHAGVPLVVVTADRPAVLRGTGANQTTDQVDIFGGAADCYDLSAPRGIAAPTTRPLHLNVQFTEPLTPDTSPALTVVPSAGPILVPAPVERGSALRVAPESEPGPEPAMLAHGPRTVVVAGDDSGPPARQLAEAAHWPLLAEPTSGSRTGEHAIRSYRILLGGPLADQIERVVVFGHPTISRPVSRLLSRPGLEVISVAPTGRWPLRPHPVTAEHDAVRVVGPESEHWLQQWREEDVRVSAGLDEIAAETFGPYAVAAAVSAALEPGMLLVVGASNPIRDLDLMHGRFPVGQRRKVIANRGLSGIDGTISTAIGAALTRRGRTLALLGDLTFLHDLNGLLLGPAEQRPDLTLVVVNDGGGSIFSVLEQGAPEYADSFERIFATPHSADLAGLCAALGVPHWRVESDAELRHALASPNGGIEVIEAQVSRADRRDLDARVRALATD